MAHFEKRIDSTRLYEGRILNLRRDTVALENGEQALREVVEHSGGVAVLALDAQDNLYFVRQYRYAHEAVLLELPAGKLEPGEDPADTGRRELREECGLEAAVYRPLGILYPTCAYDTEVIHLYYAASLTQVGQKLDENEFLTVEKIPVAQAVEMVLRDEIPDAKTQLAILKFDALRRAGAL